jgi:hypothetical protein
MIFYFNILLVIVSKNYKQITRRNPPKQPTVINNLSNLNTCSIFLPKTIIHGHGRRTRPLKCQENPQVVNLTTDRRALCVSENLQVVKIIYTSRTSAKTMRLRHLTCLADKHRLCQKQLLSLTQLSTKCCFWCLKVFYVCQMHIHKHKRH